MQEGSQNPERLNLRELLRYLSQLVADKKPLDEVFTRRIISALYFALFNYWSLKKYYKGKRGDGPYWDSFWFSKFHEHLLREGLDYAVYTLFLYRVVADHYALNPTRVILTSRPWKNMEEEVIIDDKALRKALESAYDVLDYLEKH